MAVSFVSNAIYFCSNQIILNYYYERYLASAVNANDLLLNKTYKKQQTEKIIQTSSTIQYEKN